MPASEGETLALDLAATAQSSPFDQLPDALLSQIFESIGLQAAAAARAVCKRWRAAAEAVLWSRVVVSASSVEGAKCLERLLIEADGENRGANSSGRWIHVSRGASLCLEMREPEGSDVKKMASWNQIACSLVEAFVMASGALDDVRVVFHRFFVSGGADELESFYFSEVLGALVPRGSSVCPALRSLSLRYINAASSAHAGFGKLPHLEPLLRPFPNLENLSIPAYWCVDGQAAGAIARCLPRLKRVEAGYLSVEAAGKLAALRSLEVLHVGETNSDVPERLAIESLLEGLASGPAARSLKELWFQGRPGCPLSGAALRALPRLAALERLTALYFQLDPDVGEDDLAALGSCPALRSLGPLFKLVGPENDAGSASLAARLAGLAAALERSPSLAYLALNFGKLSHSTAIQVFYGLATALERSPSLPGLELSVYLNGLPPPLALEAFAALARAARGRVLSLRMGVDPASPHLAEAAAALKLAAAPPRDLFFWTVVGEAALEGGLLDRLSAFAGCARDLRVDFFLAREYRSKPQESVARDAERAKASLAQALGISPSRVSYSGIYFESVAQ
eukprot:tig00000076_g2320.t1